MVKSLFFFCCSLASVMIVMLFVADWATFSSYTVFGGSTFVDFDC